MLKVVGRVISRKQSTHRKTFRCHRMYLARQSGYVFVVGKYHRVPLEIGKWYAYDTQKFYGPFSCRELARTAAKLLAT